jgi:hypothetical protein
MTTPRSIAAVGILVNAYFASGYDGGFDGVSPAMQRQNNGGMIGVRFDFAPQVTNMVANQGCIAISRSVLPDFL